MEEDPDDDDDVLGPAEDKRMIPRVIHQIWIDFGKGSPVPEAYKKESEKLQKMHPTWEYHLWTDDGVELFLRRHYGWFWPIYESILRPVCKCDAIRLLLLHHYGGVYLDMDIAVERPLDSLLVHQLVVPARNRFGFHNNCFLMSVPQSEFMKRCIDALPEAVRVYNWRVSTIGIMCLAGPFFLTARLREQNAEGAFFLTEFRNEDSWFFPMSDDSANPFWVHRNHMSWIGGFELLFDALLATLTVLIMVALFVHILHPPTPSGNGKFVLGDSRFFGSSPRPPSPANNNCVTRHIFSASLG